MTFDCHFLLLQLLHFRQRRNFRPDGKL